MSLLDKIDLNLPGSTELSDSLFEKIRTFIYDTTGIYFQDNKRYLLETRIGKRLKSLGYADYSAYLHFIQHGGMRTEMPMLINAVTINETYFFRSQLQFDVLLESIIPELIEIRRKEHSNRIRIWSGACSTGDEPYTLAMMIRETLQPRFPRVRFELVATDINTEVLNTARKGIYTPYAVRNVPAPYMQKYFKKDGDRFTLASEIQSMVNFKTLNLFDRQAMLTMRSFDIVLCANVLIYFDTESKQQVVNDMYNGMNTDGYLLVGYSETLYGITQAMRPVRFDKILAYKKG
jgi:chemotaxis protein methyltransferase CheR